jgi:hypothetical protein
MLEQIAPATMEQTRKRRFKYMGTKNSQAMVKDCQEWRKIVLEATGTVTLQKKKMK